MPRCDGGVHIDERGGKIPPGVRGVTVWRRCKWRSASATAIEWRPHMHLLGKSIKMELIREDESVECLTEVNDWDFDWQRTYMYPEDHTLPITINDQLRLECTYDNSEANQPILGGEKQTPQQTEWGDGTRDEMCLDYLVLAAPYRGDGQDGFCAGFENCLADCPENDAFCAMACPGTLGVQCLSCSIDGFFGDCAQSKCGSELIGFGLCYDNCNTALTLIFSSACMALVVSLLPNFTAAWTLTCAMAPVPMTFQTAPGCTRNKR